jgi:hypothetical protein
MGYLGNYGISLHRTLYLTLAQTQKAMSLNIVVEYSYHTLLLHIWRSQVQLLIWRPVNRLMFFLSPLIHMLEKYLGIGYSYFLPYSSQFVINI